MVTLTGEAGIGKTTLATAAADHAEARGATVVWGTCWEGAPPFWPWLEVLAALGMEAGLRDAGPPGQPARLHLEAAATLEAARRAGSDVRPAELAGHYLRAVDQGGQLSEVEAARAVGYSERAA